MSYVLLVFSGVGDGVWSRRCRSGRSISSASGAPSRSARSTASSPGWARRWGDGVFAAITGFGLHLGRDADRGLFHHHRAGPAAHAGMVRLSHVCRPAHDRAGRGWRQGQSQRQSTGRGRRAPTLVRAMASTFALTITNPVTLLSFRGDVRQPWGAWQAGAGSYVDAGLVVAGVWSAARPAGGWRSPPLSACSMPGSTNAGCAPSTRVRGVLVALCGLAVLFHLVRKLA